MTRTNRFEDETTIALAGRRIDDAGWLAIGAAFLAFTIWAAQDALGEKDGFAAFLVLVAAFLVWNLSGPASRLAKRRAYFEADAEALRLHPTFWPRPLPWSAVKSLSVQNDPFSRGGQLRVLLHKSERSSGHPFGTTKIGIPLRMLGLSRRDAASLLRQLRRLRGAELSAA